MSNWTTFAKVRKLDDGTVVFALPINVKAPLHFIDVEDLGPVVCKILENLENFVNQVIRLCGEKMSLEDVSKTFTRVTGIPSIAKTLPKEELFESLPWLLISAKNDLIDMYKWMGLGEAYIQHRDWTNGQKLAELKTFEDWLNKTG